MKFNVPKIVKPMKLSEYAPEFAKIEIPVWVNPPRAMLQEYLAMVESGKESPGEVGQKIAAWLSNVWSQGEEDTHWTPEEVLELVTVDSDPRLFAWCCWRTVAMITEHRVGQKKS